MKGYGEKLRKLRKAKGVIIAEVAKAVGVTTASITMYELEQRIPRDETKIALANYYGVTVEEIFFAA